MEMIPPIVLKTEGTVGTEIKPAVAACGEAVAECCYRLIYAEEFALAEDWEHAKHVVDYIPGCLDRIEKKCACPIPKEKKEDIMGFLTEAIKTKDPLHFSRIVRSTIRTITMRIGVCAK